MKGKYLDRTLITKRITIDYKKNKVSFEDPKENRFSDRHPRVRVLVSIVDIYLALAFFGVFALIFFCVVDLLINAIIGIEIFIPLFSYIYGLIPSISLKFKILGFFSVPFLVSSVIFSLYPDVMGLIPQLYYILSRKILRQVERKVEVRELKQPEFEIPLFKNYFIRYEAEGEFSKYLEKVEIKEHPFKIQKEEFLPKRLIKKILKKKVKVKEVPHPDLWRALFTFSQVPKTGKLTIWFI